MPVLTGPLLAASALLVLAGLGKLRDPSSLVRALASLGLPTRPGLVRAGAALETAVGLAALRTGSAPAALAVAVSYLAFTLVVLHGLRRGGVLASCGCFGRADTPPTPTHVAVTGAAAALCAAAALTPPGPLPGLLQGPGGGAPLLLATAALAVTAYLALAVLPLLHGLRPAARS